MIEKLISLVDTAVDDLRKSPKSHAGRPEGGYLCCANDDAPAHIRHSCDKMLLGSFLTEIDDNKWEDCKDYASSPESMYKKIATMAKDATHKCLPDDDTAVNGMHFNCSPIKLPVPTLFDIIKQQVNEMEFDDAAFDQRSAVVGFKKA